MKIFSIFVNRNLHQSFKRFVWRLEEDYVLRLGGIQLRLDRDQKLAINPVYYPIFSWKARPGSYELTVFLGTLAYTLVLSRRGIYVFKSTEAEIEERE